MQIITTPILSSGIFRPIVAALNQCFPSVTDIDLSKTNWTDVFDKNKPSLVFTDIKYVDSKLLELRREFPECKIVLFGNGSPEGLNPDIICVNQSINPRILKNINADKREGQVIKIRESADITFQDARPFDFDIDIGCLIGGLGEFRSISPLLTEFDNIGCRFNIVTKDDSDISLPIAEHIGTINYREDFVRFVKTCKVYLETTVDTQNLLNIAAYGGFAITLRPTQLFPALDNFWMIESFLKNSKARKKISKDAQQKILSNNTCYHELLTILNQIGNKYLIEKVSQELKGRTSWILES